MCWVLEAQGVIVDEVLRGGQAPRCSQGEELCSRILVGAGRMGCELASKARREEGEWCQL